MLIKGFLSRFCECNAHVTTIKKFYIILSESLLFFKICAVLLSRWLMKARCWTQPFRGKNTVLLVSVSFHFNFERCTIMFLPSHSLWLTDASFGSNELKLTRAEWVKYHTWLYLTSLCMYCVCVFACMRENTLSISYFNQCAH